MKRYNKYYNVDFDYFDQLPEGWKLLPNIAIFEATVKMNNSVVFTVSGKGDDSKN